jgi:hypothetical protein
MDGMNAQYDWQKQYLAAVLETDNGRIKNRIEEAQAAIRARMEELGKDHMSTAEERTAIEDALRGLGVLSRERK